MLPRLVAAVVGEDKATPNVSRVRGYKEEEGVLSLSSGERHALVVTLYLLQQCHTSLTTSLLVVVVVIVIVFVICSSSLTWCDGMTGDWRVGGSTHLLRRHHQDASYGC
jgi:hypothetical protein